MTLDLPEPLGPTIDENDFVNSKKKKSNLNYCI